VGPDNGVLSFALMGAEVRDIRRLEDARHFRRPVSRTFHGRDILPQRKEPSRQPAAMPTTGVRPPSARDADGCFKPRI
jgi:hypothetical protein